MYIYGKVGVEFCSNMLQIKSLAPVFERVMVSVVIPSQTFNTTEEEAGLTPNTGGGAPTPCRQTLVSMSLFNMLRVAE